MVATSAALSTARREADLLGEVNSELLAGAPPGPDLAAVVRAMEAENEAKSARVLEVSPKMSP